MSRVQSALFVIGNAKSATGEGVLLVECSERMTIFSLQDLISAVRGCSRSWQYETRNVQSCVLDVLVTCEGGHMII